VRNWGDIELPDEDELLEPETVGNLPRIDSLGRRLRQTNSGESPPPWGGDRICSLARNRALTPYPRKFFHAPTHVDGDLFCQLDIE
jgi:hypothetical protein